MTSFCTLQNTSDLLGVAGIDVPIQSLKNLSPFEALGPNGYTFIINHNGFIVMHPRLSPQLSYLLVSNRAAKLCESVVLQL